MIPLNTHQSIAKALVIFIGSVAFIGFTGSAHAQSASHPEAKSPLKENPYLKHADPWRWDIRTQVFLRWGIKYTPVNTGRKEDHREQAETVIWPMNDLEIIYPVVREGAFYWSPNKEVVASIRADHFTQSPETQRLYTDNTKSEYSQWKWNSEIKNENVSQFHIIHTSHIVTADTIFDEKKAKLLAWPAQWNSEAAALLSPIVDSVGEAVSPDADETLKTIVDYWLEDNDPKSISQVDLVKFITGKVIEHVQIRTPPAEFSTRSGFRTPIPTQTTNQVTISGSNNWSGFIVRSADVIAREPKGSKHDLAILLTSALRTAGVPARTLLCVDEGRNDVMEKMVSMVEFAMYDPDLDLTFWVPIDVDRLRLNGRRSAQYSQTWNYFGSHDLLNNYIPVAYYFHPPASYKAYDLPALFGLRSSSPLPNYVVQSLLIDPIVSNVSVPKKPIKKQP